MTYKRVVCSCCGWRGSSSDIRSAPSPFDPKDTLYACPVCRQIELRGTCDEPDCWDEDTCGTPTPDGYRRTCYTHMPQGEDE